MYQDWTIDIVDLDFDQCLVAGTTDRQAVRVDPSNGTMALVRMRVTIYNPVY
jgi:hypothetical protein